mgnify:FL=1
MKRKADFKRRCRYLLLPAVVLLIELFIFNYRHWESLGCREVTGESLNSRIYFADGYRQTGGNTYIAGEGSLEILVEGIGAELKTARIHIQVLNGGKEKESPVVIRQLVTDESHRLYYELPRREIWAGEKRSAYMTYHLYGKCGNLKIIPLLNKGDEILVSLSLNPVIPLFFSWERVFALLLLLGLVCLLRPSSRLHQVPYLKLKWHQRFLFFAVHGALFFSLTGLNPFFQKETGGNQQQYQKLAESLKAGNFFVMEEPPEVLKNMENPYDFAYRNQLMEESGEGYQWDHAYYEGKYYVYFGVVPVLLFYLPFYLLTGRHMANHTVIFLLSLLFLLGVLGVIHELIRKWFPKASLALWVLITELVLTGSNIIYMTKRPDLYTVPILSGLSFGMLGLWCFLRAVGGRKLSCVCIALGSFLTALIAGCRPQLFVFAVLAVFLLVQHVLLYSEKKSPAKMKLLFGPALSFLLPMLFVAAALMYYNYSRFGSVFDFGANYNLTFNDMRRRGFHFDRIPLGIFAYLFAPVKITEQFPFAQAVYFDSQYLGVTIQEATFGGLFRCNFFSWFGLLPFLFSGYFRRENQSVWKMALLLVFSAVAVLVVDTNMSGILMRYFSDFSLFFMLASALSAFALSQHFALSCGGSVASGQQGSGGFFWAGMIWLLLLSLIGALIYQGMIFFLDTGESLRDFRPDLYSHVKYLTAFWL